MPPAHRGPTGSPMDRWTDASPSAISSGFQNAMSLGPQPRLDMPPSGLNTAAASFNTDDEDDDEDEDDGDAAAKKSDGKQAKGKKGAAAAKSKDAKAAQHRKEQNRAAQREFRQRKQQYIRALEARVELLSSDHDTQVNRLRYALRHLLAENNSLRGIVGSLAHFIGARSIGGCLVEAGMTRQMLENTMNSSSEKTMSEAWANWPGAGECEMLKQLRKESNIPADGLPESKLVNYFRDANGKAIGDQSTDADKKKRTADDTAAKDSKRKRKTNDTIASRNSSPAAHADQRTSSGQPSVASPQSMAPNEMTQPWQQQQQQQQQTQQMQQQQQQQQQMSSALPSQFWQPASFGGSLSMRNDVDSMFAQTLLGGGNADMGGLAAMTGSLFPTDNQSVFSQQQSMAFNNVLPTPASAMPNNSTPVPSFNFLGFGGVPSMVGASADSALGSVPFGAQPSSPARGDTKAILHTPASPATGGVEGTVLRSGTRASPEEIRNLRRRSARAIAQVNRIWAQRGANNFLNLPVQYPLDEEDLKFLEQQEATNPHIKIAYMRLPNEWDEGDLAGGSASGSPDGSRIKTRYDIEKQAEYFLQISYHLHNHSLNPSYSLPPSLRPTPLQQSTPHDHAIDMLPNAPLRDKLIQNPGLETHNVVIDVIRFLAPSDGDMNIERNWVLTLPFFVRYPQLADPAMVANMNRQRAMRGEKEVTIDDIWREHRAFTEYTQAKLKEIS